MVHDALAVSHDLMNYIIMFSEELVGQLRSDRFWFKRTVLCLCMMQLVFTMLLNVFLFCCFKLYPHMTSEVQKIFLSLC